MLRDFVLVALILGAGTRAWEVTGLENPENHRRAYFWTKLQQDLLAELFGG